MGQQRPRLGGASSIDPGAALNLRRIDPLPRRDFSMNHASLPPSAGIGLRAPHVRAALDGHPDIRWIELHSENVFGGGPASLLVQQLAGRYPLSLHGVGMGLGALDPLDTRHLAELTRLVRTVKPAAVSEHLSFNRAHGKVVNDLLPLPYTPETLAHVAQRVDQVQHTLGCQLLVENVSACLASPDDCLGEGEFLAELAARTGCGVLLDVNNLYVNQCNLGRDALAAMQALPVEVVGEIHLAGFIWRDGMVIDSHSRPVCEDVWALYQAALTRFGPCPTLIEWDLDIPPLPVLLGEAARAQAALDACRAGEQARAHIEAEAA